MAGNPTVTISVLADATAAAAGLTDTATAIDKVGAAAAGADGKVASAAGDLDKYAAAASSAAGPARDIAGGIETAGGHAGDMAGAFGQLGPALEAAGFPQAAAALDTMTIGLDAAEGATVLFRVAQETGTIATLKDTAVRVAHNVATVAMSAASKAAAAAQWLLNAAMSANPIGLIIALVLLLVGAVILAYQKSETFRTIVNAAWAAVLATVQRVVAWIKGAASTIWAGIQTGVQTLKGIITTAWGVIRTAVDTVRSFIAGLDLWSGIEAGIRGLQGVWDTIWGALIGPVQAVVDVVNNVIGAIQGVISWFGQLSVPDWVGGLLGRSTGAAAASAAYSPVGRGAPTPRASGAAPTSSGGITINVAGALDPDAVARQIAAILTRQARRRSGTVIGVGA